MIFFMDIVFRNNIIMHRIRGSQPKQIVRRIYKSRRMLIYSYTLDARAKEGRRGGGGGAFSIFESW